MPILCLKDLIFWITSRTKHPKQSQEAQEKFKKLQIESIKFIHGYITLNNMDFWFQDEAWFGQKILPLIFGQPKEVVRGR